MASEFKNLLRQVQEPLCREIEERDQEIVDLKVGLEAAHSEKTLISKLNDDLKTDNASLVEEIELLKEEIELVRKMQDEAENGQAELQAEVHKLSSFRRATANVAPKKAKRKRKIPVKKQETTPVKPQRDDGKNATKSEIDAKDQDIAELTTKLSKLMTKLHNHYTNSQQELCDARRESDEFHYKRVVDKDELIKNYRSSIAAKSKKIVCLSSRLRSYADSEY